MTGYFKECTAAAVAIVLLVPACTTLDPYTREEKTSNAAKGAAIGAASGAVIGLISGDDSSERKKRALIGAGLGALAGGAVGAYMDQQELELRQELEATGVSVTRIGDNITLNMPGNVTFAVDSADINASFYPVLRSVALVLNRYSKTFIEVAGHTDNTGTEAYNQALSERRAESVVAYITTFEVRFDRFIMVGAGELRPIATNDTPEGRQQNRRVEITIVPVTA
ncbi:MAG: OmpA family protein [Chromatiales bacterium]|nr:MAG: OmpA family protein [Chromatiales bacterium]